MNNAVKRDVITGRLVLGWIYMTTLIISSSALAEEKSPFNGEGEIGMLITGGNTETESVNSKLKLNYETAHCLNTAGFEAMYSAEEVEDDTSGKTEKETTAEKYLISAKTGYKFNEANYIFMLGSCEDDRFSGYDYQISLSAGYGHRFIKNDRITLELEVGPGYRINRLDDGEKEEDTILRGSGLFALKLTETSSFQQDVSVETGQDNTITRAVSAIKTQIVGALSMKASFTLKNTSQVPEDTKRTDTETALTLVYDF